MPQTIPQHDLHEQPQPKWVRARWLWPLTLIAAFVAGGSMGLFMQPDPEVEVEQIEVEPADIEATREQLEDLRAELSTFEEDLDTREDELESLLAELEGDVAGADSDVLDAMHPDGFPVVVPVSDLPSQVASSYESSGHTEAVALAPGVWTPLPEGASMESAVRAGTMDGWCASIEEFVAAYRDGQRGGGGCW